MRNIILCGFMGCGKTTVGRELAALTGRPFADMDAVIEQRAGMSVSDIFRRFGEDDFRRREREACAVLAARQGVIVASGGGALTFPENAKTLSATGTIVLLEISPETALRRLEGDESRPLLARPDREDALQRLFDARLPMYRRAAALRVDGEAPTRSVAQAVLSALRAAGDPDWGSVPPDANEKNG